MLTSILIYRSFFNDVKILKNMSEDNHIKKDSEKDQVTPDPEVVAEPEPVIIKEEISEESETSDYLLAVSEAESDRSSRVSFEEFTDERLLVSHDMFGNKQMKIKVLEVSDENPPIKWKFGDRVKVNKILVTIKHLASQEVEEGEFDIEAIERELAEKRHYTSTNRWVPVNDIKNGYVVGSRHTTLISDASALDYILF